MTAYCYVDFAKQWEMASTPKKQERCGQETANGAVYLESFLRNADWLTFGRCWGTALEMGVLSIIKSTRNGIDWVQATTSNRRSIADEVTSWQTAHIHFYKTQWQNYKSLGVIETFSIENAFSYPLTLKYSNSSSQLDVQTSFKMQWPLANILSRITSNFSSLQGSCLIRESPNFIYANQTTANVLITAGMLASPLGPGLSLVQTVLGPFGSVDMKRVACPPSLRSHYQNLTFFTTSFLSTQADVQNAFWSIYSSFTMEPTPSIWDNLEQRGGNILCELDTTVEALQDRPAISFSSKGSCGTGLQETVYGDTTGILSAVLSLPSVNITKIAAREKFNPGTSEQLITQTWSFVQTHVPVLQIQNLRTQAQTVKNIIRDEIEISLIQFLFDGALYSLSTINIFDLSQADFELYAWLYMFDWVQGIREVVNFQGDVGNLTSISTSTTFIQVAVNPMEVPLNVAYYMRCFLQYITWVMLGVACLVCLYIFDLRGQIEASNILSFSRMTSLVWIGRPLILLRALSAVCLLSTSTLQLSRPYEGLVSYFESVPQPWYMILLTASELNWMVFIINDIFSIVTDKYTRGYSITSFYLVWVASAVWAFAAPPARSIVIDRVCSVVQVDYQ
ncbi:hypothetical protein As57867_004673, partial [Aphanomyces stellatus]